ncbi:hypothetical protein ASU91_21065 [Enterobacter hormaechei subsp. steigerwaltii]|uniref:Uncharacterized protein n=1 Tax=Salmonella senftenberg TaxID=28150 RepID=A0A4P7LZU2_SALSE|nr:MULTISPECIES: hypothetical protein [Enterobacteriaceae]EAA8985513.1 hypothetical protein [Salmonella enterica]ECK1507428.1 hypothetical protein [Salmonella enterica subsp. enterica serovar Braenderup]EJI0453639.1 hypothetical protein [Salmonella enterica subsp. enterica serovar Altona]HBA2762716.1 hypothetical protein [Escherichia coli]HBV1689741.1 hypothetical protein [Klebsiella pneumoniae]
MAKFNLIGKNPEQAQKYFTFWKIVNAGEEEQYQKAMELSLEPGFNMNKTKTNGLFFMEDMMISCRKEFFSLFMDTHRQTVKYHLSRRTYPIPELIIASYMGNYTRRAKDKEWIENMTANIVCFLDAMLATGTHKRLQHLDSYEKLIAKVEEYYMGVIADLPSVRLYEALKAKAAGNEQAELKEVIAATTGTTKKRRL